MMTKLTATSVMLLAISFPSLAVAESCGPGRSAQSPAVKMLQRQLSALRSIQRARGCKPGDSGGGENPVTVSEIPSQSFRPAPDNIVRIVGPAFIPDADNKAFGRMRRHQN